MNDTYGHAQEAEVMRNKDLAQAPETRSLKVLVIDDSITLLRVLQEGLEEFGHTIIGAQSGHEALEILEDTPVDVIVCDLGMPDMNGWDVGKAVHDIFSQGRTRTKIPFILLTGWAARLTPEDTRPEAGVDAILEKPIDLIALAKKVSELATT
jgi:CheY-like chemotaxis protein